MRADRPWRSFTPPRYPAVHSDNAAGSWQASRMSLRLRTGVLTDLGLIRSNNEDAMHAGERLLAIADGIGGAPAGELASEIVIQALTAVEETARADTVL